MVNPSDAAHLSQPNTLERRHTDSPQLWLAVVVGSIAVHLVLLLQTLPLLLKVSSAQSGAQSSHAPTPVEMIELAPEASSSTNQRSSGQPQRTPVDIPSPSQAEQPSAPPIPQLNPDSYPIQAGQPPEAIARPRDPRPRDFRNPNPEQPTQPSTPPPQAREFPNPPQRPDSPEDFQPGDPNNDLANAPQQPSLPPVPQGDSNQPPTENSGDSLNLPTVAIDQEAAPPSFRASVNLSQVSPGENQNDIPDQQPSTDVTRRSFVSDISQSGCTVTPDVVRSLGETVVMQVVVEADGSVSAIRVRDPRPTSPDYEALASCLVKSWTFTPAVTQGQPVASDSLIVSITINR